MTAFFLPQEYSCSAQMSSDLPLVIMSPTPAYATNPTDVNPPLFPQDQFSNPFYTTVATPDASASIQPAGSMQYVAAAPANSMPFFADGYSHGFAPSIMTRINPQQLVSSSLLPGARFIRITPGPYDQCQEAQQESLFARVKRQKDENYRYSLGCISRRVRSWLEKSKPFANEAQSNLEDQLVADSNDFDGGDGSVYELFDESRKKRFIPSYNLSASGTMAAAHPDVQAAYPGTATAGTAVMSNPFLYSAEMPPGALSPGSPRCLLGNVSVSEDLHGSCQAEQEFVVRFPKQIPPICPTAGINVQFEDLTDRSVLRNWRCRTDEGDVLFRKGRKRFFKRVAVLPPDSWIPNKRPRPWEWAPSGPFALNLGEYVSISGTNGYPYEIVLIRHIQPALRCFISLVPVPRELASQMLNGERITPESDLIVHVPVDSVTHKWILNGVRPRDFTRDMASDFIKKDIELEREQKERKRARKSDITNPTLIGSPFFSLDSLVTTPEDDLIRSSGSNDSLGAGGANALVI